MCNFSIKILMSWYLILAKPNQIWLSLPFARIAICKISVCPSLTKFDKVCLTAMPKSFILIRWLQWWQWRIWITKSASDGWRLKIVYFCHVSYLIVVIFVSYSLIQIFIIIILTPNWRRSHLKIEWIPIFGINNIVYLIRSKCAVD